MKKLFIGLSCAGLLFSMVNCSRDGQIRERPKDIVPTGPRAEIYQKIMALFPESKNVPESQGSLFDSSASKHVVLTNESAVYVTFISEGASYPNSFGWYAYNESNKPAHASELELHVLFPHVSDRVLKQGDRLQLGEGKFPAGTVIGFFLIINGWEAGTINYERETFYTDFQFNPDQQQQHVLFRQQELGDIVLTFEDKLRSHQSDHDFNDIIFTVTDNTNDQPVSNFDLANVPQL